MRGDVILIRWIAFVFRWFSFIMRSNKKKKIESWIRSFHEPVFALDNTNGALMRERNFIQVNSCLIVHSISWWYIAFFKHSMKHSQITFDEIDTCETGLLESLSLTSTWSPWIRHWTWAWPIRWKCSSKTLSTPWFAVRRVTIIMINWSILSSIWYPCCLQVCLQSSSVLTQESLSPKFKLLPWSINAIFCQYLISVWFFSRALNHKSRRDVLLSLARERSIDYLLIISSPSFFRLFCLTTTHTSFNFNRSSIVNAMLWFESSWSAGWTVDGGPIDGAHPMAFRIEIGFVRFDDDPVTNKSSRAKQNEETKLSLSLSLVGVLFSSDGIAPTPERRMTFLIFVFSCNDRQTFATPFTLFHSPRCSSLSPRIKACR